MKNYLVKYRSGTRMIMIIVTLTHNNNNNNERYHAYRGDFFFSSEIFKLMRR